MGNKGSKKEGGERNLTTTGELSLEGLSVNHTSLEPRLAGTVLENINPDLFPLIASYFKACRVRWMPTLHHNYEFKLRMGSEGKAEYEGKFQHPYSIAFDDSGLIYVADRNNHRIQIFDEFGSYVKHLGGLGSELFIAPSGVTFDAEGNLIVIDASVHVFDKALKLKRKFGTLGTEDGHFSEIRGIATDHEGNLILVDSPAHKMEVFTLQGEYVRTFGKGTSLPLGVCVGGEGHIFVSGEYSRVVTVFDQKGSKLREFSTGLDSTWGLAVGTNGFVIVDNSNHNFTIFDFDGNLVYQYQKEGQEDGSLFWPRGVAIDKKGQIYIADNHRVQIFKGIEAAK